MTDAIVHRGPDDGGAWTQGEVGLAMRRLSIIDVEGGQQPILSADGSRVIVFNGEIYNYLALRDELEKQGHAFRTKSDTEVILRLYEAHGIDCVRHLRGMFAFAIYDQPEKRIFLARDRLGIKPLYYWTKGGAFVFGSEIKSILACDEVPRRPRLSAIDAYLSLRYVPGPGTLFAEIEKFPAAHYGLWHGGELKTKRYWSPEAYAGPYEDDEYYAHAYAETFDEAVRIRLMSEVPLGAYLSGGVDSSAIVAAMSRLVAKPVKTFSVGFDWEKDELPAARQVAKTLGCDHHEVTCGPEHFEKLPHMIWNLDEPLGDAIIVPMFLLSRLAREHVTVVLSGEGADETTAGYLFHKVMLWARRYARITPNFLNRSLFPRILRMVPAKLLDLAFDYPGALGDRGRRKLADYLTLLGEGHPGKEYRHLISLFDDRDKGELYEASMRSALPDGPTLASTEGSRGSYLDRVLALQYEHWLPDDILMKQDKMSMANSIEARVPFMDHKLVELLLRTPPHLKLGLWKDKVILRSYLAKALPGDVARRKKKAFYIPLDKYLRGGPLRDLVETCLSEASVRKRGYFDPSAVRRLVSAVNDGDFLYGKQVFSLLSLEIWHRIFIDGETGWIS